MAYLSVNEFQLLYRALTLEERERFAIISENVEDAVKQEAKNRGVDLVDEINKGNILIGVIKQVECDIIARYMSQSVDTANVNANTSDEVYAITPTPGVRIWKSELARLGLLNQQKKRVEL